MNTFQCLEKLTHRCEIFNIKQASVNVLPLCVFCHQFFSSSFSVDPVLCSEMAVEKLGSGENPRSHDGPGHRRDPGKHCACVEMMAHSYDGSGRSS